MKRRYKHGDWFRVPLGGPYDAIGVITRMCRSRLFGYFFAIASDLEPAFGDLKALRASDAAACALFGGAGLEEARWRVIATSVPFDPAAWPFPQFASRGVFGRTWRAVTYDPETMSAVSRAEVSAEQAAHMPDARFATPEELEALLRLRIDGEMPGVPLSVYEVRPPLDAARLQILERGGRVQFSEMLSPADIDALATFVANHPAVELRVHGIADFDLRALAPLRGLRSLVLDVPRASNVHALSQLHALESLKVGAMDERIPLDALTSLRHLRRLELHGTNADAAIAERLHALDTLTLYATPPVRFDRMSSAARLRTLVLAHMSSESIALHSLMALERLSLRGMALASLPDLSANAHLQTIELRDVTVLRDLSPLASAPALRELRIEGMRQLQMADFGPLAGCARLRNVFIEIGSKTKTREIYRMLRRP